MTPRVLPLLLLVLLARPSDAQTTVGGVAVDSRLKRPLPCVTVRMLGPDSVPRASTRASATGTFEFTVSDTGTYQLRFEAWGFHPVTTGAQRIVPGERSAKMYGMWLYPIVDTLNLGYTLVFGAEQPPEFIRYEEPVPQLALEHVGDVFARFAVDSAGRVDTMSIVLIRADSPDMDTMARRYLARSIWIPGRIGERPVCTLVGQRFVFSFGR